MPLTDVGVDTAPRLHGRRADRLHPAATQDIQPRYQCWDDDRPPRGPPRTCRASACANLDAFWRRVTRLRRAVLFSRTLFETSHDFIHHAL